jgi:cytochrome bd ubiquinol oxidase subunit II
MTTLWFGIVAAMFAIYAVLDGFDIGVGVVYLLVARNDEDRRALLGSIGPVWDGNEVWLLAAGGVLFFAFPAAYASGFSGFYLPLMMVLWLLILRGIAIEFRDRIASLVWTPFWDVVFAGSSVLLALFFGVALGNILRGVPLDKDGNFFLALWTDFLVRPTPGILDWFTIALGIASVSVLGMHGAAWVAMNSGGPLKARARNVSNWSWVAVALLTLVLLTFVPLILPHFGRRYADHPLALVFPLLAAASLAGVRFMTRAARDAAAFLCSCGYILAAFASAAFGHYPYLLPGISVGQHGLTIFDASTSDSGLRIGLYWFIPGVILAGAYSVFAYRWLFAETASE